MITLIAICTSIITPSSNEIDGKDINNIYKFLNIPISCGSIHPGDAVTFGVDEPHKITVIQLLRKLREELFFENYNQKITTNKEVFVETGKGFDNKQVIKIPYTQASNEALSGLINRLTTYLTEQKKLENVTDQFKESFKRLIINFFKITPKKLIAADDLANEYIQYNKSLQLKTRKKFEAQQNYSVELLNTLQHGAAAEKEKSARDKEKQDVLGKKPSTHVDPLAILKSGIASQTGSGTASNESDTSDEDENEDEIESPVQTEKEPDTSSVMQALELASMLPKQQFKPPYRPEFED